MSKVAGTQDTLRCPGCCQGDEKKPKRGFRRVSAEHENDSGVRCEDCVIAALERHPVSVLAPLLHRAMAHLGKRPAAKELVDEIRVLLRPPRKPR